MTVYGSVEKENMNLIQRWFGRFVTGKVCWCNSRLFTRNIRWSNRRLFTRNIRWRHGRLRTWFLCRASRGKKRRASRWKQRRECTRRQGNYLADSITINPKGKWKLNQRPSSELIGREPTFTSVALATIPAIKPHFTLCQIVLVAVFTTTYGRCISDAGTAGY